MGWVSLNVLPSTLDYKWLCFPIFRDTPLKWHVLPKILYPLSHFIAPAVWPAEMTAAHPHCLCANLTQPVRPSSSPTPCTGAWPSCLCLPAARVKTKGGLNWCFLLCWGRPGSGVWLALRGYLAIVKTIWDCPKNSKPWKLLWLREVSLMRNTPGVDQCL